MASRADHILKPGKDVKDGKDDKDDKDDKDGKDDKDEKDDKDGKNYKDGKDDKDDEGRHSEPGKLVVDSMTRTAVSEMWSICLRLARHTNLLT